MSLDEVFERKTLKETHGRGILVDVFTGEPGRTTAIAIHGIHGSPVDVAPLMQSEIDLGHTVKAFVYDDEFRSLQDSSADLATSIGRWVDEHPGRALRLDAHSMGGRVALGALNILCQQRRLTGEVEVNLIGSPIAGVKSANFSLLWPGFIPWIRPLHGVAPASKYQQMIDGLLLPNNVIVNVFAGDHDEVFNASTKKYRDLVRHLHGTLTIFHGATHVSILDVVARQR